jgi:protein TonB
VRLGPGIDPPRKIKDVKAIYPAGSLSGRLRGTVVIEATIGTDGKVYDARVVRSIAGLDQAALDAVRQWEFEPARLNGAAVAVIMTVTVSFAII